MVICKDFIYNFGLCFLSYQEGHPSPGKLFQGGVFEAFLPDCEKTWELLPRLKKAFEQGLTFTVTGKETGARVTWDCIPHKTSLQGGKSGWVRLVGMSNRAVELKATLVHVSEIYFCLSQERLPRFHLLESLVWGLGHPWDWGATSQVLRIKTIWEGLLCYVYICG